MKGPRLFSCCHENKGNIDAFGRIAAIQSIYITFDKAKSCTHLLDFVKWHPLGYIKIRAVASLTVPVGQDLHFPRSFLKFRSIFHIFPQTFLIFFLILTLWVGDSSTRKGPGFATDYDPLPRRSFCLQEYKHGEKSIWPWVTCDQDIFKDVEDSKL